MKSSECAQENRAGNGRKGSEVPGSAKTDTRRRKAPEARRVVDLAACTNVQTIEDMAAAENVDIALEDMRRNSSCFKPCVELGWCPYGRKLTEEFPKTMVEAEAVGFSTARVPIRCYATGHHCPAFYLADSCSDPCATASAPSQCSQCTAGLRECPKGVEWRRAAGFEDLDYCISEDELHGAWVPREFEDGRNADDVRRPELLPDDELS